ncbi:MAG: ABC transporter ATP-binding protein [Pseudorhodoplanes sp.]|uniref:ABC transporter ATP-binding protein n=1 Tax=Pseudorhodoplanes sp. TaxID=1934341 RepID=UPI003D14EF59
MEGPALTADRPILEIDNLKTYFFSRSGVVPAVDGMSYSLRRGEIVGVVGESGCGKSVTALSVLGLIPPSDGRIVGGRILFEGRDLVQAGDEEMRAIRGNKISMIFQEPMSSLNPVLTIGRQISETICLHQGLDRKSALDKAVAMLRLVQISEPERRIGEYPHQLSGGMRQRVMIAMALACNPQVLLADEPTTALDVTIQAQILDLLLDLRSRLGAAMIMITHDLGVIAEIAQRVVVMYAGRKVEEASVVDLFDSPQHPYTRGLLQSVPKIEDARRDAPLGRRPRLTEIKGSVPSVNNRPKGCLFEPRCTFATDACRAAYPPLEAKRPGHLAACWHSDRVSGASA